MRLLRMNLLIKNGKMRADELYLKSNVRSMRSFRSELLHLSKSNAIKIICHTNVTDISNEMISIDNFTVELI